MQVAYKISSDELDSNFLKSIKQLFKAKEIYINISDEYQDDTEYLLSNQANAKRLLNSINNIENTKEKLIHKSIEDLGWYGVSV
ncbi:MAG: hypothetical protein KU38_07765 [Sulfurovum sp. FS08-3]|nr:MAG: hypothetical protein KU38_07765 [Sulfurovum sp. FS08-3]